MQITGSGALVTGGASGLGLATARRLTAAGATVTIIDLPNSAGAEMAAELAAEHPVTSIGVGAAGFVGADRQTVLFAPNLAWRDEPLGRLVSEATGLPTVIENDANAAGWGEARHGAAKDADSAVVITVGTGIGGAIITGGRLQRGSNGFAGELGHFIIRPDGRRCGCGLHAACRRAARP